ncbi:MAG: hypothetical protein JWN08_2464 [Frankiales bacterium]|nr:hypothetical protein [Frankiales bacterium]
MVPAHQRLHADDPTAGQLDLRLVVHDELPGLERGAQVLLHPQPLHRGLAARGTPHDGAGATSGLRLVHRDVGVAQERLGVAAHLAGPGHDDAHAGAHDELVAGDGNRRRQRPLHPLGELDGTLLVQLGCHDDELVTSQPRDQVAVAAGAGQARGDRAEQFVAGAVAERVVDHLEPVEVEEQQRQRTAGVEQVLEVLVERSTVGQTGQRVTEGLPLQPVRALDTPGDVAGRALQLEHPALGPHGPDHRLDPHPPAVRGRHPVPAGRDLAGAQDPDEGGDERCLVVLVDEVGGRPCLQLGRLAAEDVPQRRRGVQARPVVAVPRDDVGEGGDRRVRLRSPSRCSGRAATTIQFVPDGRRTPMSMASRTSLRARTSGQSSSGQSVPSGRTMTTEAARSASSVACAGRTPTAVSYAASQTSTCSWSSTTIRPTATVSSAASWSASSALRSASSCAGDDGSRAVTHHDRTGTSGRPGFRHRPPGPGPGRPPAAPRRRGARGPSRPRPAASSGPATA